VDEPEKAISERSTEDDDDAILDTAEDVKNDDAIKTCIYLRTLWNHINPDNELDLKSYAKYKKSRDIMLHDPAVKGGIKEFLKFKLILLSRKIKVYLNRNLWKEEFGERNDSGAESDRKSDDESKGGNKSEYPIDRAIDEEVKIVEAHHIETKT